MADREGCLATARALERGQNWRFYDQGTFGMKLQTDEDGWHLCGTTSCVAGFAAEQYQGTPTWPEDTYDVGMRVLGFTNDEAACLFAFSWKPEGWRPGMSRRKTVLLVAQALRRIADGAPVSAVGFVGVLK